MKNDQEHQFGKSLLQLVAHLIKNAEKVPPVALDAALEFEAFTWEKLSKDDQCARMKEIQRETGADSRIEKHFEAYPHAFSKNRYAEYRSALREYTEALGI